MVQPMLRLVACAEPSESIITYDEQCRDHHAIVNGFLDTYITQGFVDTSRDRARDVLTLWFAHQVGVEASYRDTRPRLFVWQAMEPVVGRERMVAYAKELMNGTRKRSTVLLRLGILRRFFGYVLDCPYIPGDPPQSIVSKYGCIEQPMLRQDYPKYVVAHQREGQVLVGSQLQQFYAFIRDVYVPANQKPSTAWRDYTMIVLAAESGLRADELCRLDSQGDHCDLFYTESRVQTRHGKGTKGSGKRTRTTIFTPFAKATVRAYEAQIRPRFRHAATHPALFLTESGERMTYGAMRSGLQHIVQAAVEAGLAVSPQMGWHDFRRSFATRFVMQDQQERSIGVLSKMLGHQYPSTTLKYVRLPQAFCESVMEAYYHDLMPSVDE